MFHHYHAFHSPWYVFASVDLHISPPGLVRTLHPLLQAVLRPPGLIENVSQNLELLLERQLVQPCSRPDLYVVLLLVSTCPPPRLASLGCRSHDSASSIKSRCVFESDKNSDFMLSSLACSNVGSLPLSSFPLRLNSPQDVLRHF